MKLTTDEVTEAIESGDYVGFCIKCEAYHECIEPDAEKYTCEECNTPTVYGAEQILIMGLCS